jgi:hypothetical protein
MRVKMTEEKKEKKQPNFSVPPDVQAHYANLVRITHSSSELVLDYARMLPDLKQPEALVRIILSPLSAKLLHRALGENLAKYESRYGEIKLPGPASLADSLFQPRE